MYFKLKQMLIRHEGLRLKPYKDTLGYTTIGVGRCLDKKGLSKLEALFLLSNDIRECVEDLETIEGFKELNEARQAVLINMRFNLGGHGIRNFQRMWMAIWDEDFDEASQQMLASKWADQVGQRAVELASIMARGEW